MNDEDGSANVADLQDGPMLGVSDELDRLRSRDSSARILDCENHYGTQPAL